MTMFENMLLLSLNEGHASDFTTLTPVVLFNMTFRGEWEH